MSVATDTANAVVSFLNAGDFGEPLTASRTYRPMVELKELGETILLSVVPASIGYQRMSRADTQCSMRVDIGVQTRIQSNADDPPAIDAEIEAMLLMVEKIALELRGERLPDMDCALCLTVENEPVYVAEYIETKRMFMSVLQVFLEVLP